MSNPFANLGGNLQGIPYDLIPVTPNDSTNNVGTDSATGDDNVAIGLYVETGGDVVITTRNGSDRTIAVPDYFYLIVGLSRVKSTGTTATGIFALVV
jgi:hypothetical protein